MDDVIGIDPEIHPPSREPVATVNCNTPRAAELGKVAPRALTTSGAPAWARCGIWDHIVRVTPAAIYFGRNQLILNKWRKTKQETPKHRRLLNQREAVQT